MGIGISLICFLILGIGLLKGKDFFEIFEEQEPYSRYIIAPISGVRLDSVNKINISIFEIGKASQLKSILSNDTDGYYIAVQINNIYDDLIAIEEAKNKGLIIQALENVNSVLPDEVEIRSFSYNKEDSKISLSGFSLDRASLIAFKSGLEQKFENVKFPPSSWTQGEDIEFNVHFTFK